MGQSAPPATPWLVARGQGGLDGLVQTLLDFEQQPGRFALALREPRVLFDHTHAVLLLAAGRTVEGLPPLLPGQHTGAVQQAARYFVRTVLLRPGSDHYSVLGLQPEHEPEALRDHYRLMIRLTHPDFAVGAAEEWPADAASRINQANDVLSSVVKRREYDASLAAQAQNAPASGSAAPAASAHPLKPRVKASPKAESRSEDKDHYDAYDRYETRERRKRQRKFALAGTGAVVCAVLLWLMTPGQNEGSLVAQRPQGNTAPAQPSAIEQAKAELAADQATRTLTEAAAPNAPSASSPASTAPPTPAKPAATPTASPTLTALAPATAQDQPTTPTRQATTVRVSAAPAQIDSAANNTDDNRLALALETRLSMTPVGSVSVTPPTNSLSNTNTNATETPTTPSPDTSGNTSNTNNPSGLTMAHVQHKLSQVLGGLQSGKGENAVQWLDGHWRDHPAAANFVNGYQRFVGDQRVTRLGKAQFRSRSMAEHFVVDGVVEISLQDDRPTSQTGQTGQTSPSTQTKELNMSAYFMAKDGRPVLTQLVLNRPR